MTYEQVFNSLARIGYETMFDDKWDDLSSHSIERTLWLSIAENIVKELRGLYHLSLN